MSRSRGQSNLILYIGDTPPPPKKKKKKKKKEKVYFVIGVGERDARDVFRAPQNHCFLNNVDLLKSL